MGKVAMNLQDSFLNAARRQNVNVTIALNDGTKLKGKVNGFDNFTVILDVNKVQHLIYKHAIATIFPDRPLERHHNNAPVANNSQATPAGSSPAAIKKSSGAETPNPSPADIEKFKLTMESK